MIKLILSDVDGTLLAHGEKSLQDRVFDVINELDEKNVIFAAASGRGYADLAGLFEPVKDKIGFVCSDGAMTVYKDKVLNVSDMGKEEATRLLWDIRNVEGCEYLLYGRDRVYANPKTMQYSDFLKLRYGEQCHIVQSPSNVEDDFLKVAIYSQKGVKNISQYFIDRWSSSFDIVYNSNEWMEFVAKGISKVTGVNVLCRHFGIDINEVIAFGDGGNDVKLLGEVGTGYAMEYASEHVKRAADDVTSDVMNTICNVLLK